MCEDLAKEASKPTNGSSKPSFEDLQDTASLKGKAGHVNHPRGQLKQIPWNSSWAGTRQLPGTRGFIRFGSFREGRQTSHQLAKANSMARTLVHGYDGYYKRKKVLGVLFGDELICDSCLVRGTP